MKTLLIITEDLYGHSHDYFKEDINYLVNELDVYCEASNNRFTNIIEEQKRYQSSPDDYTDCITINARGYSQGDWQDYKVYYNESDLNTPQMRAYFDSLLKQLKRSFTHFNDYFCELFEYEEIDGKKFISEEAYDCTSFHIDHVEFPEIDDIIEAYNDIYGKNYDELKYDK